MYTVLGASGNTGRMIANILLDDGEKVRAIGRNPENLKSLGEKGAEIFIGDIGDEEFLTKAFDGMKAVFVLIPPNYNADNFSEYQDRIGETIVNAIKNSSVRYIVNLSSVGANLPDKNGPIAGLHRQEKRLNQLENLSILHLRPAYFMENLLANIDMIKSMGILGSAIKGDLSFPMVATRDIAKVAAYHLLDLDFEEITYQELLGPTDVSFEFITEMLSKKLNLPDLKYVQFPYEDFRNALINSSGLKEDLADMYVEMSKSFNEGLIVHQDKRSPMTNTTTSFEEFSDIFVQAFNS